MEEEVLLVGMAAVPIITGILQAVKGFIPDKLVPFAAMTIGVAWNVGLTAGTDEFDRTAIFLGMVIGLAASGLYSAGRVVVNEAAERLK
jgi:hypothetical protein